jgi:hypothetical protein
MGSRTEYILYYNTTSATTVPLCCVATVTRHAALVALPIS